MWTVSRNYDLTSPHYGMLYYLEIMINLIRNMTFYQSIFKNYEILSWNCDPFYHKFDSGYPGVFFFFPTQQIWVFRSYIIAYDTFQALLHYLVKLLFLNMGFIGIITFIESAVYDFSPPQNYLWDGTINCSSPRQKCEHIKIDLHSLDKVMLCKKI